MLLSNTLEHLSFLYKEGGLTKVWDTFLQNVAFDLKHGTRTTEWLQKHDFEVKPDNFDHGVRYRAAATNEVSEALEKVSQYIDISQAGYYDLGCGKGKTLCIAGLQHDFNSITGVDYYSPFIKQAQSNLDTLGLKNINLEFNDMTQFTKFEKKAVVFLYNPADEIVLDKVRENLEENTDQALVIYNKPIHEDVFQNWNLLDKKVNDDPDHCTSIFTFS